jgi:hypothetical protein
MKTNFKTFRLRSIIVLLCLSVGGMFSQAHAEEVAFNSTMSWKEYDAAVGEPRKLETAEGWGYLVSGSLALAGGIVGAGISSDPLAKGVYSLSQTIGIAALGYGSYKLMVGSDHQAFQNSLRGTKLSERQRNDLVRGYLAYRQEEVRKTERVKAITHGLIAGLNFYNASIEKNNDLKTVFYFIGGINALAAIHFAF